MSLSIKQESETLEGEHHPDEVEIVKNEKDEKPVDIKAEVKPDLPTKSSMEILSELFSTFHAEPPLIIKKENSPESVTEKHKKKKKHKHKEKKHKKKHKKKRRSSNSSNDDTKINLVELMIKQEKELSVQKIKIESSDVSANEDKDQCKVEKMDDLKESDGKTPEGSPTRNPKQNKITIQDLKKSSVLENMLSRKSDEDETSSNSKEKKHKKKHKEKSKKRSRSKSKDRHKKKLKVSDLRDVLKEKESKSKHKYTDESLVEDYDFRDRYVNKERDRSKDRYYESRHAFDKYKDESEFRKSRKNNPFYKEYDELNHSSHERDKWRNKDR